jgi:hypothetical protein
VRQAPHGSLFKFCVSWSEVEFVDAPSQVFRNIKLAFNESFIDDHLGSDIGEFSLAPCFDLLLHGTEISLHPIHADRDRVDQREGLRMLSKDWCKVAMNNMAKLPFELSVPISRARLKPHRGTRIVEY